MEKAKISSKQLFTLIVLFEIGSAVVVGLGMKAKQDAWLAILLGMICGLVLYLMYNYLFYKYPKLPLTVYIEKLLGKFLGRVLALIYILYFIYIASRVLRDFGELIITTTLYETPLFVVNFLMILLIGYGIYLGIEVLGRSGEILFVVMILLSLLFIFLVFASDLPKLKNLQPVLENGFRPVLTTVFPLTLTFPFGEMIVFTMLLPYLNKPSKSLKLGLYAMIFSGLFLSFVITLNISILGPDGAANATFPLYNSISKVNVGNIIQRIDLIAVFTLIIGGFFKIAIFSYASVIGLGELFNTNNHKKLVLPVCSIILISSILIASNFVEHIEIGLDKVPYYLHIPLQVVIPFLLFIVSLVRKS